MLHFCGVFMNKQPLVTEQTRNNFINSFWEQYKTMDFSKITVCNICKIANYNRTTFYRYFNDIDDLLIQLENRIIDGIKKDIYNSPKKELIFSLENFTKFNTIFGEYIVYFYKKNNVSFIIKFKELIKNGVFKYFKITFRNNNEKEFLYEFLFASTINAYAYWYFHPDIISFETLVDFINNAIIRSTNLLAKG